MAVICTPDALQSDARCFCLSEAQLDSIWIYLLVAWENHEAPQLGWVFGDPDAGWSFGDPGTGDEFGAPL